MINEDYIGFETAKLLKEKGFDWNWSPFYSEQDRDEWIQNNYYTIPNKNFDPNIPFDFETLTIVVPHVSIQMAMKWLREVHKIGIFPSTYTHIIADNTTHTYGTAIINLNTYELMTEDYLARDTYEEAAEAAIKYCLENFI